jgi:mono/diheme cytochrome c family protein
MNMSINRYPSIAAAAALGIVIGLGGCARTTETTQGSAAADCNPDRGAPRAPAEIRALSNPLEATMENIAAGRALYEVTARPVACAECHGIDGDGQGPLARHLDPAPPNFTCDFYRAVPDGQLFWITREGSGFMRVEEGIVDARRPGRRDRSTAMRPHRYYLTETETWQVISYLRTFHADAQD